MRRLLPILAVVVLAGCGGGSALEQTGKNISKIHSGVLDLRLVVTPRGGGEPFGFELKGPFALNAGKLPVLRIAYTQIANGASETATLVSNGRRAWIVSRGTTRELPPARARTLTFPGGFSGMDIGSWVRDAKTQDDGGVERIAGVLDAVAAANGLRGLAAASGRDVTKIEGDDAKRLEAAVRSSRVLVVTTKNDHLLRRLTAFADLGLDVPATLRKALGTTVGARIDFRLAIGRPNSRVVVAGP